MVGDAGNAPVRHFQQYFGDSRFTVGLLDHLPYILVAGVGVAPTEAELMRLA
jgi:hypothetical protein